ncbi:DUF4362 domain-containing protein [Bacillus manliponensis]|uniref:DUF4362 domain-containing protein n=1 Tax=Bacillus manliponensis TaxID=574376 RepID=UPI003516D856
MRMVVCICLLVFSLIGCSKQSTVDEKSDVIVKMEGIENIDTFKKFIANMKKGKENEVQIVHYTKEGDPIFETVKYNGKEIEYVKDNSQDKLGDKEIEFDTCRSMSEEKREDRTVYALTKCEKGNTYELITVPEL